MRGDRRRGRWRTTRIIDTADARSKNRDALNADDRTAVCEAGSSAEWIERSNDAGVPCGPIYSIDQVFADPQVKHLGMAQKVAQPQLGARGWSASR